MKGLTKWLLRGGLALLILVAVAFTALYALSGVRLGKSYAEVPAGDLSVPTDSASVAYGRHVAVTRGCTDCHRDDLSGGIVIEGGSAFAQIYASNLTRGAGGVAGSYDAPHWARAIRHGIAHDGRALLFMPSYDYFPMSDRDVGALVAYMESLPPVDNDLPASTVGPMGRALFVTGRFPLVPAEMVDHEAPRPEAPEPGVTVAYGGYLAVACTGCHNAAYTGGPIPGAPPDAPPAANITPDPGSGIGSWTESDFFTALRQGRRPDGTELDPVWMPWRSAGQMTDDEIRALWMYLQTVPAATSAY